MRKFVRGYAFQFSLVEFLQNARGKTNYRVLWVAQQRRAEEEYQAWKRDVMKGAKDGKDGKPVTLKRLSALAPRAKHAAFWAPRLAYEMETGIDVGPSSDSSAYVREVSEVSQADIDTMRFSRNPTL